MLNDKRDFLYVLLFEFADVYDRGCSTINLNYLN